MATRRNFPTRKQARREQAEERQSARNERSAQQQLAKLDSLGYAAKRERARLSK